MAAGDTSQNSLPKSKFQQLITKFFLIEQAILYIKKAVHKEQLLYTII
jgi:hypothetical protein